MDCCALAQEYWLFALRGRSGDSGELLNGLEGIGLRGVLVRAVTFHACKAQREAALVTGADLDLVERYLDHQLGFDVNGVTITSDLELQQLRGLPFEHLVGESLEGLAEHRVATFLGVARAQMKIAKPALAASVAPFRGEDHEIERTSALDFEPALSARSGCVRSHQGLRHYTFVAARDSGVQEIL